MIKGMSLLMMFGNLSSRYLLKMFYHKKKKAI